MVTRNLSYKCVDAWKGKITNEATRLYWIGNYYDMDVYDESELSAETVDILVKKCANIFKEMNLKDKPLILYLPNVLQLPIATLASLRIGLTVLPISAMDENVGYLRGIIKESSADTVITVDGFWYGTRLIRSKELLDEAVMDVPIKRILVIRHVSPDEKMPPPQVHLIGRRPYYLYKVAMKENRDFWWSGFFPKASSDCEAEILGTEYNPLLLPHKDALLPISMEELQAKIKHVENFAQQEDINLIISTRNVFYQILCFISILKKGATPLIYEGDIKHPDPSRISQLISTYKVTKLIITEADLSELLNYKEYITMWELKTLNEIMILGNEELSEDAGITFGVACKNINLAL
ncbi:unnamed protein product [Thelazia callipaeda]|uniref:AMP-binding domain-containing protein n=1 Tax=Thelazia callipaeda TaxID=103827 RepID=A0A0N5CLW3_THECL|nr:unnamed protein product [Thelazia callipaeda]